jgi:membrane protein implicated in regulation of membrane protease activity
MKGGDKMDLTIMWLIILVVLVIIEISTMGLYTIWFAGGAVVATIVAAFHGPIWVQILLFLLVSIAMLISTRPIVVKYFNKDRVKTNVESLIGTQGVVISEIDNLKGAGLVTLSGMEWTARSKDDEILLAVGKVVNVIEVQGVKLIVEERKEEV